MVNKSINSVAVIVPNYNSEGLINKSIQSLLLQSYECTIVIVDNASKDIYDDSFTRNERVKIMHNKKNLGFAGGVNTGIRWALEQKFQYIALFNDDAIADKEWLSSLVKVLDSNDDVSISTGLLLHNDGTIDSTSEVYSSWGMSFPRDRNKLSSKAPGSGYTFGATGGATLYRSSLFNEIGLFDETFFAYFEDIDMSFRAQLAGSKVYYTKEAIAYHEQGVTSKKIPGFTVYQMYKNLPMLFWKNIPNKLLLKIGLRFLFLYTAMFSKSISRGSAVPAIKGLTASIYYFWTSALLKRFNIQATKKVSNDYIWSLIYKDLPPDQTGMRKFRKIFTGK
jgi:GT2 family glycosyltransferase